MRYLRMFSNSVLVGLVAAVYLAQLVLLLNPAVPLTIGASAPVLAVMTLSYGVHIAAFTYVAFVVRQMARLEPLWPAWVSLRMLAWTSGVASAAVAALLWLNVGGLRTALDLATLQALTQGAVIMSVASALMLVLALTRTYVQRAPVVVAALFTTLALVSIAAPLSLRGGRAPREVSAPATSAMALPAVPGDPRVVALLLDGASLDIITPAVAAGRLPNFARLLESGASMHLATTRPTQAEPVWSSVVTGKWPAKHGVRGAAVYRPFAGGRTLDVLPDLLFTQALVRFGFLVEEPHTPASLSASPLWRILTRRGIATGIIGLPLTHPAEPVSGFMVSDRYHRRLDPAVQLDPRPDVYPGTLEAPAMEPPALPARMELLPDTGESGSDVVADQVHYALARQLDAARDVRVLAVRYAGLDAVAHYYLRYADPGSFGDVSQAERQQFGRVLDDYYAYVDALVGSALSTLRDGDLLLVVSGFGMEPLTPGKRLLERLVGNAQFSGTHERAPDGFLLAFGSPVAPGRIPRGALVDVTPTLLYFLDQPVGRDMDGFARTDLFTDAFNAARTIAFIPTYDR